MNDVSKPSTKVLIGGLLAFLWVGFLFGGYFWAHRPFELATLVAIGTAVLNVAVWLIITFLGMALGFILLKNVFADEAPLSLLVLSTGVGLGLIAVIMGVLGLLGLFQPIIAWGLIIVLAGITVRQWRPLWAHLRYLPKPQPDTRFQQFILWYAIISLVLTFLIALAPIVAWDSLTYHLVGPKYFIEAGRFVHPVNIPHMGFPLLGQMQFTLGMLLVGDGTAPLLHYGYGLLSLGMTITLARHLFNREVAWWSAMVLLSVPTFFTLMAWPYVDITLMFYTTAVFYTFYRWKETKQTGWLVLTGLMIGFSGGLKYTAIAMPIAVTFGIMWESRRDGLVLIIKRLFIVGAIAFALVIPWLTENILTTGNPVYPFFFENGKFWDEWWAWWYDLPGTGLWSIAPGRLLIVPLEATIAGTEGSDFYEATIGPFILGLLFLLPVVWFKFDQRDKGIVAYLLLFFALNYLLWINGVARTALLLRARFFFLVFGFTAVLDGLILHRLKRFQHPQLNIPWLINTIIGLTLILMLTNYIIFFIHLHPLTAVTGLEDEQHYMERRIGTYQTVMSEGINQLPPESNVVFLWEPRTYGCRTDLTCDPDPILGRFLHLTQHKAFDAATIAAEWQTMGITHVLLAQDGLEFLLDAAKTNPIGSHIREEDLMILNELKQTYLTEIENWEDQYILYELNVLD